MSLKHAKELKILRRENTHLRLAGKIYLVEWKGSLT
ncbi:hypothetical protein [Bacillus phage SPO1L3]|nr:hypothetical protein [Bacillus phage SPO1L3]WIT26764.1 hypothetical protein [Bacillus phage SPO1L5]